MAIAQINKKVENKKQFDEISCVMKKIMKMNGTLYMSVLVIYLSMFLNNVLLTTVVPVLPDILNNIENPDNELLQSNNNQTIRYLDLVYKSMKKMLPQETEKAALLLSSKSVIQLAINPLIAVLITRIGYHVSLLIGNVILLVTSFVFAFGNSFVALVFCRGLHGIASVTITVSGMCICAKIFCNDENSRSKYMGIILSSEALGVLVGYSFGAFTYNLVGKSTPFVVIGLIILANIALLMLCERSIVEAQQNGNITFPTNNSKYHHLIGDSFILVILGAIFISSSTVAILEPCLPYWLLEHIKLKDWQTGLIFLPDSIGYLLSTSTCGVIAYKIGRWKITAFALIVVGSCSMMIPNANTLIQLSLPHFGIGLGIGAVDCAMIPLLANYVDLQQNFHYGSVYALQQVVTSSAYVCGNVYSSKVYNALLFLVWDLFVIFGAFLGGELMEIIGFPSIMRTIGILNVIYCVAFIIYGSKHSLLTNKSDSWCISPYQPINQPIELISIKNNRNYHSFRASEDSD